LLKFADQAGVQDGPPLGPPLVAVWPMARSIAKVVQEGQKGSTQTAA
jgi:hypothetical protein